MAIVYRDISLKEEREIEWMLLSSSLGPTKFVLSTTPKPNQFDKGDHTEIILSLDEAKKLKVYLDSLEELK